jgi:tetratricopeptide (TPR) repeat protein
VHLKNGGTIACDRIEERGDDLVLHQGKGRIVVPRRDVARIEATAAPPSSSSGRAPGAAGPERTGGTAPPPAMSTGSGQQAAPFDREQTLRRLTELKGRMQQFPLAREENRVQVVSLLCRLGEDDLKQGHADEARRRFEEALQFDSHSVPARGGLAAAYLSQGRDSFARSVLEQALLEAPDNPDLLLLLGAVAQKQDRQEEALAAWEKSLAARPDPLLRERMETLRRQQAIEQGYRRTEGADFILRYDGERISPDVEAAILGELESRFSDLVRQFDHVPSLPIAVVVYPGQAFYEATQADANVAGLYDGKIRLPAGGLRDLSREVRAVLLHELAHAFITDKSGGRAPRWLQEGLAQWIEGRRTTTATARQLARGWRDSRTGPAWGSTFTYASALSFVEFLLDREGFHGLNLVLNEMGRGSDADEAVRAALRFSIPELLTLWGEDLARRHLQ